MNTYKTLAEQLDALAETKEYSHFIITKLEVIDGSEGDTVKPEKPSEGESQAGHDYEAPADIQRRESC